ncbi:MAG TPA: phosphoglycerate mutase, partial [Thermodesulfobacteriota bacterium]|nr:phosphoglycerate mutase [Thermodesulfobacteriota bacterium]
MADYPLSELQGKTPLQVAKTPNLDQMAKKGVLGLVRTVPLAMSPGSDVANLSIFGYDPALYFTGRAPLEAAAMGVKLNPEDVAFRCNLVTLGSRNGRETMDDFSAGHISTGEARKIIQEVGEILGTDEFHFFPGVSYRHLLVWRNGERGLKARTTPPHDISGKEIAEFLPRGSGQEEILSLMAKAKKVLTDFPVNQERLKAGKK